MTFIDAALIAVLAYVGGIVTHVWWRRTGDELDRIASEEIEDQHELWPG